IGGNPFRCGKMPPGSSWLGAAGAGTYARTRAPASPCRFRRTAFPGRPTEARKGPAGSCTKDYGPREDGSTVFSGRALFFRFLLLPNPASIKKIDCASVGETCFLTPNSPLPRRKRTMRAFRWPTALFVLGALAVSAQAETLAWVFKKDT